MKLFARTFAFLMLFSAAAWAADIEMVPVESSLLTKVGYDPETKVLAVQMHNNLDTYLNKDVPAAVFENLLAAPSKGGFYVKNIKGKFPTERK